MKFCKPFCLVLATLGFAAVSPAQSLHVTVTSPEDPDLSLTLSGNDIADIFDQAISREAELEIFEGLEIDASLNYLGVEESLIVNVAPDGRSAELTIPSTGLRQNFEASSMGALQNEIEDYIKEGGSDEIAKFRKEANKVSPVGITDGSPNSTTASVSDTLFRLASPYDMGNRVLDGWSVVAESSSWSAGTLKGENMTLRIAGAFRIGERSKLRVAAPLESRTIGDSKIYGGAYALAWDFEVVSADEESQWSWNASPLLAVAGRGSEELAAGGVLWTYGINTVAKRKFGDDHHLGFVAQFNGYQGIPLDYDGFQLDDDIDQSMLKGGVQYCRQFVKGSRVFTSWTWSQFLEDAAIEDFNTFKVGLAKSFASSSTFLLSAAQTKGGNYDETRFSVGLRW